MRGNIEAEGEGGVSVSRVSISYHTAVCSKREKLCNLPFDDHLLPLSRCPRSYRREGGHLSKRGLHNFVRLVIVLSDRLDFPYKNGNTATAGISQ